MSGINLNIINDLEAKAHRSTSQLGEDAGLPSDGMLSKDELNSFVINLRLDTDFLSDDYERDHLQAYLSTAIDNVGTDGKLELSQVLDLLRDYDPNQQDPTSDGLSSVLTADNNEPTEETEPVQASEPAQQLTPTEEPASEEGGDEILEPALPDAPEVPIDGASFSSGGNTIELKENYTFQDFTENLKISEGSKGGHPYNIPVYGVAIKDTLKEMFPDLGEALIDARVDAIFEEGAAKGRMRLGDVFHALNTSGDELLLSVDDFN